MVKEWFFIILIYIFYYKILNLIELGWFFLELLVFVNLVDDLYLFGN